MALMNPVFYEFMTNFGWSANKFMRHAKFVSENVPAGCTLQIGRSSVVVFKGDQIKLRAFINYKGRGYDELTITDPDGKPIKAFSSSTPPSAMLSEIRQLL